MSSRFRKLGTVEIAASGVSDALLGLVQHFNPDQSWELDTELTEPIEDERVYRFTIEESVNEMSPEVLVAQLSTLFDSLAVMTEMAKNEQQARYIAYMFDGKIPAMLSRLFEYAHVCGIDVERLIEDAKNR